MADNHSNFALIASRTSGTGQSLSIAIYADRRVEAVVTARAKVQSLSDSGFTRFELFDCRGDTDVIICRFKVRVELLRIIT